MRRSQWELILEYFKQQEQPECVLMIAGNAALIRILVAWGNVPVTRKKRLSKCVDGNDTLQWEWLWENTHFSIETLAARLPVKDKALEQKVNALIANRILYPDGTLNGFVERYLREKIVRMFSIPGRNMTKTV